MNMEFKHLSRNYFEEYYYVLVNLNKFIHSPNRKIKFVTKQLIPSVYAAFFLAIIVGCLALLDHSLLPYLFLPIFAFIAIFAAYFITASHLKKLGAAHHCATLTTSKKSLTLHLAELGDLCVDWQDIKTIRCGKHAIILIPQLPDQPLIALPISARAKLQQTLKEYQLSALMS